MTYVIMSDVLHPIINSLKECFRELYINEETLQLLNENVIDLIKELKLKSKVSLSSPFETVYLTCKQVR